MERSEPSLIPEWLKSSGNRSSGSGNSNQQFPSSHSDKCSVSRHINKLFVDREHDIGRPSVLDRTASAYLRRSSSGNGAANSRAYKSFGKGRRDNYREKDTNGYRDREKDSHNNHRNRNYFDTLDNMLPTMFEKDALQRSQSMITGKHSDIWKSKTTNDSSPPNKSNLNSINGLLSTVNTGNGNKREFEREFLVLCTEERQIESEIGRVSSPGLSTVQTIPVGTSAVTGSDGWTSALAEPVGLENIAPGDAVASQNVSAGSASMTPTTKTCLNMAETLAKASSRAHVQPLLNVGTQRLEELAIKQSRQLIPLVTTTPKTPVNCSASLRMVSPSEKSKPKVGQQQPSPSLNYTRGGTSTYDNLKVCNESRLQILKPSRETNGISLTTKNSLSPTNGSSGKVMNSSLSVTPAPVSSAPLRTSGNSPTFAPAGHDHTPSRVTIEKRPTAQAQSRNDFFRLLKKKATLHSASSVSDFGPAMSLSVSEKSDGLGTEDYNTSVTMQDRGVPSSEISIVDLPTDNRSTETTDNGDAYAGPEQHSNSEDRHSSPDEEEAAFLRSLGWEENAEDDGGLTEEEISAFFEKHMKSKLFAGVFHRLQSIALPNSRNPTQGGSSSALSLMDSNGEV